MQNVACPTMIVVSENVWSLNVKNAFSAMPVMIPGSASGRIRTNEIASRPKKRKRCTAKAAIDPRIIARAVAIRPALTDSQNADRASALCHVDDSHFVDRPGIGQLCTFDRLNA